MSDSAAVHGGRYAALDVLRGLAIISMVIYHAVWDMVYLRGAYLPWYRETPGFIWQQSILWSFVFISGFCQALGKRQYRRGAMVFAAGAVVTAATLIVTPASGIIFGVLTFLGSAMLIFALFEPLLKKCPPAAGLIISAALFILTREAPKGCLGFGALRIRALPASLYRDYFTAFLGFPPRSFISADYVPLIPWLFLFASGFFSCRLLKKNSALDFLRYPRVSPAEWLGRHSLEIYLFHQPLLYLLMMIV